MDRLEAVRMSALADAYSLLAVMLDRPTFVLAEGLASGSLLRDAQSIAEEAGLGSAWASAVDVFLVSGEAPQTNAIDGDEALSAYLHQLRIEHTRLFEHPVSPAVPLFEGQFLYKVKQNNPSAGDAPTRRARFGAKEEPECAGRARAVRKEDFFDERPRLFVNDAALDAERCYRKAGLKRSADKNIPADSMITELQFIAHLHAETARALLGKNLREIEAWEFLIEEFNRIHLRKWAYDFFYAIEKETRLEAYRLLGALGVALFDARL